MTENFGIENNNEGEVRNEHGFTEAEWNAMDDMDREGYEMAALHEQAHPEILTKPEKIPYTQDMADKIEEWFWDFEERFPLDQLHAIETEEEANKSELREVAKEVSKDLHKIIKETIEGTNISKEDELKIEERRKRISMAIGHIVTETGKVRHS